MKRLRTILLSSTLILSLMPTSVFASAPTKEDIEYLGKGKVEVEFRQDVEYKNVKVSVKDSSGKTYRTTITKRDDDDIKFLVKNYKTAKTYHFTISGVRKEGTSSYGKVKGSFKIPSNTGNISASKAKSIALKHAGLTASKVHDLEVERENKNGKSYYEVNFETATKEYEYHISLKGKILFVEVERD